MIPPPHCEQRLQLPYLTKQEPPFPRGLAVNPVGLQASPILYLLALVLLCRALYSIPWVNFSLASGTFAGHSWHT